MSLLHLFRWFGQTHFSIFIRRSTYGFAIIEMVHLLALAALGGAILVVDLRVLGIGLRRQPISRIARELSVLLLFLAITFYFTLHRRAVSQSADTATSVWSKVAAVVSLTLWLGVGLAGRAIGFL